MVYLLNFNEIMPIFKLFLDTDPIIDEECLK